MEEMDGEQDSINYSAGFSSYDMLRRAEPGGQQLTQLQDKLTKGPTTPLAADPAALGQAVDDFFLSPALFFVINVCPSSGSPWQTWGLWCTARL